MIDIIYYIIIHRECVVSAIFEHLSTKILSVFFFLYCGDEISINCFIIEHKKN